MTWPHYSEMPPIQKRQFEDKLDDTFVQFQDGSGTHAPAVGWINATSLAFRYGYRVDSSDIPTPHLHEVARRERAGDLRRAADYSRLYVIQLDYERKALARVASYETAYAGPHPSEIAAKEAAERQAAGRAADIERRAHEAVESAERAEREKRLARARAQI